MKFEHYREADLSQVRDLLLDVYAEIYRDRLDDPFFSVDSFAERLGRQVSVGGWEAVVAWDGTDAVGYAYGASLPSGSRWWRTTVPPLSEAYTAEDGKRTLAVFEVMVRERWRGGGVSEDLHTELMAARNEERATLLVEEGHPRVKALYEGWGYEQIGVQQPFPAAPVYAVMVKALGSDH